MDLFQGYNFQPIPRLFFLLVFIWSIVWEALALWRAAKLNQKYWFIAILLLSVYTFGVAPIIYLFFFAKNKMTIEELKGFINIK